MALRVGAGQRLVEMMMGVDEAGDNDMARGVEKLRHERGVTPAGTNSTMRDAFDDDAACGIVRENGQG